MAETARPPLRSGALWAGLAVGAAALACLGVWLLRRDRDEGPSERIKQKVSVLAQDLIRDHWAAMRAAVEQVGTDEGAKAFYASHPGLSGRLPSEQTFLEKARAWRPLLRPLPEALPALEAHDLSYVRKQEQVEMSYRSANGAFIFMKWAEGRLVEMRVY